jgi:hypothetical protein
MLPDVMRTAMFRFALGPTFVVMLPARIAA